MAGGILASLASAIGIGKDVKDAADGIGSNVEKIIAISKGVLPADLQVQVDQIKADTEVKLETIQQGSDTSLQNFILQYEGAAKDIPKWLLILRDIIRPVTTIVFFLQLVCIVTVDLYRYMFLAAKGWELLSGLPNGYWVIQGIIFGFWFGGKAGERIASAISGK